MARGIIKDPRQRWYEIVVIAFFIVALLLTLIPLCVRPKPSFKILSHKQKVIVVKETETGTELSEKDVIYYHK